MAKAGFLAKKSGVMMMETETSNGYGSDKGSALRNLDGLGVQPTYKSPGMAAAACLRYPFTTAQWQELERQALIFKYMMASVPVPPDLLIPTTNLSSVSASSLSRGWFANGDPEPGRCKRTDGKKWRCSRDAAPDQKYCERHMHRSRPRSRKHVELHTDNTPTTPSLPHSSSSATRPYPPPPLFLSNKPDFKSLPMETLGSASSPYKDPRFMGWMLKGELGQGQDLQQLMDDAPQGSWARGASLYQQSCYQENQSLNLYTDFAQAQGDECCLYLNPEMDPSDHHRPRHFIDAWSNASPRGGTSCKLSPSTLSLSMSSDNGAGEDMDQIQMGLGVMDSECHNKPPQALSWMTPASWVGGPLGEVLQSTNTISPVSPRKRGINFMTDDWGGSSSSRHTSPRGGGTAISSPSGVLHKSLTSPSDSSGGNSPTYKTAAGKTEVFLQWMNHNK